MHPSIDPPSPSRRNACALTFLVLVSVPSVFLGQDGSAPDFRTIGNALSAIKNRQAAAVASQRNTVFQAFRTASGDTGSALAFYQDAMRSTVFTGQSNGQTQFHDWKMQSAGKFKDPTFLNALRFHLEYIVLTMERGNGATAKQMMPALLDYAARAARAGQSLRDPFMKKDISSSIFVEWYQIRDWIASAPGWEMRPGAVDGIFGLTILPEMRAEKDPRVLDYWDNKINTESLNASDTKITFEIDKFNQVRRPSLLWARAKDQMAIGQKNNAIKAMFALINDNPNHPNASDWVAELEGIIHDQTAAAAPPPGAPAPVRVVTTTAPFPSAAPPAQPH